MCPDDEVFAHCASESSLMLSQSPLQMSLVLYYSLFLYKIIMCYVEQYGSDSEITEGVASLQIKVGEIIKAKREEMDISLVDFAKQVGISPGYLSQLENGRKTNPNLELIMRIADELDIDLEELLGIEQDNESPAAKVPSLLRLVIAKDRNMKVLEDREIQKKIGSLLDHLFESKYLIEDDALYRLFLEDVYVQAETTLKRYMSVEILKNFNWK